MSTKLLKAPLYAVSQEWEHNGRDDSDFYRVMFDPNTGELKRVETWSTRYGCLSYPGRWFVPETETPEAVWQAAESKYREAAFQSMKQLEEIDVMQPNDAKPGDILRLVEPHNSRKTKTVLADGTRIRVNTCGAFGTFYLNGYKKPNRFNRSVVGTVVGHPQTLVRVPLEKCRLDREVASDVELQARAAKVAAQAVEAKSFYRGFATSSVSMV